MHYVQQPDGTRYIEGIMFLLPLHEGPCRNITTMFQPIIIFKTKDRFLVTNSFIDFAYLDICSKPFINGKFIGGCFNILINLQYLPSLDFFTNLCWNGGGGLGKGTNFYIIFHTLSIAFFEYPVTLITSSSLIASTSNSDGIRGIMVFLLLWVGIHIQCSLFFGFLMVLLGSMPGRRGFTIVDN